MASASNSYTQPEASAPEGRIANVDATLTTVIGQLESEANVKKVCPSPITITCEKVGI